MTPSTQRRRPGLVALASILLGVLGCGRGGPTLPAADPAQARQTLRAALDAWRAGQPADAPAQGSPPLRVIDEDWRAGCKLDSYEVDPQDRFLGPNLRCLVTLRLRDRAGRSVRKIVAFDIATGPSPSVIRQD